MFGGSHVATLGGGKSNLGGGTSGSNLMGTFGGIKTGSNVAPNV